MADGALIRSEDDAWIALEQALAQEDLPDEPPSGVGFSSWPSINVYLPATPVKGSISPTMMEAFIELQNTIYRAHTFLSSDTGDLRTLSKREKEQFEFHVQVKDGSSKYEIDLTQIAQSLGSDIIGKMTGQQLVITVLGLALILGGVVVIRSWLNAKTEQRKLELADEDKKGWLTNYQAQLTHDTRRMEMLARAIERQPVLGEIEASADTARTRLVRAVGEEQGGSILGVDLPPEIASEITVQKRQAATETRISGNYKVAKVDTTVPDGFRVTLVDISSGEEISASLRDAIVSAEHKAIIQEAEWKKQVIFVEMAARRLRQRIVDAVVVNVQPGSV